MPGNEQQYNKLRDPEMVSRWNSLLTAVRNADAAMFNNTPYQQAGHEALQELAPNPVPAEQKPNENAQIKIPASAMPERPVVLPVRAEVSATDQIRQAVNDAYEGVGA